MIRVLIAISLLWIVAFGAPTEGSAGGFDAEETAIQSLDMFLGLAAAVQRACTDGSRPACNAARDKLEEFAEADLGTGLQVAVDEVCGASNTKVVKNYLAVLDKTRNVSDERLADTLAKMYTCQPSTVVRCIMELNCDLRRYVSDLLSLGVENIRRYGHREPSDDQVEADLNQIRACP